MALLSPASINLYSDEEPLEGGKGGGGETMTHNHRSTGTNIEGVVYASPENGELDMSMKEDGSLKCVYTAPVDPAMPTGHIMPRTQLGSGNKESEDTESPFWQQGVAIA
ncbi:hypothetical protein PAL_GLEAN10015088 [Pteropus alecto]|uniref:Uncharacterized protein n=1 Tax=Pteropus alecto TaxID=9402 RepID=L5JUV4_PTEAL|nr:hypothetical protein PAL_GLEAN10015088 [Pteropus alecto]